MTLGIVLAALVAVAVAIYTVSVRSAAQHIDALFGALVISATALVVELILLLPRIGRVRLFTEPRALLFAAVAGVCAVGVDYLTLRAYGSGLRVSIGAPIIIGGGIALATITGLILGERIDAARLAGVCLVIAGAVVLGVTGR